MFTFAINPENRVAVETILLIICSLAAMFVGQPHKLAEKQAVGSQHRVTVH